MSQAPRTAVIGAGIAGLSCATALSQAGFDVHVFDKARGPGGRMSTRRGEAGRFDHGAQFMTVRDPGFRAAMDGWQRDGLVSEWKARVVTLRGGHVAAPADEKRRFVCVPRMNALARALQEDLPVDYGVRIERAEPQDDGLALVDEGGSPRGRFERLVVATPAPQAIPLLSLAPDLARRASTVELLPCIAVMTTFAAPLDAPFDAAFVEDSPLSWIAREASKPGREAGERWVLHASAEWSEAHLEEDPAAAPALLLEALGKALGKPLPAVAHQAAHRWRYALAKRWLEDGFLLDAEARVGACGDWCAGSRVEDAWRSGVALAGEILRRAEARPGA
ncbi:MAG: NAD(P)-binding protein [Myxococcota bacterium]|nr:NAD(P)-binding protein [Myxococcota bacterium]